MPSRCRCAELEPVRIETADSIVDEALQAFSDDLAARSSVDLTSDREIRLRARPAGSEGSTHRQRTHAQKEGLLAPATASMVVKSVSAEMITCP